MKLTKAQRLEIYNEYNINKDNGITYGFLANKYNISRSSIKNIVDNPERLKKESQLDRIETKLDRLLELLSVQK